jgi:hypothetical protein
MLLWFEFFLCQLAEGTVLSPAAARDYNEPRVDPPNLTCLATVVAETGAPPKRHAPNLRPHLFTREPG